MNPKEHLQQGRSEIRAAKDATTDEEVEELLDYLVRGADLVAPDHRPIQPQNILRIKIQLNTITDMSTEAEVTERLEQAKEHFETVYETAQTELSFDMGDEPQP